MFLSFNNNQVPVACYPTSRIQRIQIIPVLLPPLWHGVKWLSGSCLEDFIRGLEVWRSVRLDFWMHANYYRKFNLS